MNDKLCKKATVTVKLTATPEFWSSKVYADKGVLAALEKNFVGNQIRRSRVARPRQRSRPKHQLAEGIYDAHFKSADCQVLQAATREL